MITAFFTGVIVAIPTSLVAMKLLNSSLQYTRLEIGFESKSEEELYDRLTKLMDKVAKLRQVCDCQEK